MVLFVYRAGLEVSAHSGVRTYVQKLEEHRRCPALCLVFLGQDLSLNPELTIFSAKLLAKSTIQPPDHVLDACRYTGLLYVCLESE